MKTTIIGGGNIGTLMAAELAAKGHQVVIYTSRPHMWQPQIDVYDREERFALSGKGIVATDDLSLAVRNAEIVWITVPAQILPSMAEKLLPVVQAGQKIGVLPGTGGAEFAMRKLIGKGCILFGLQRVHSIARLKEYGRSVYMLGRKSELFLASIPASFTDQLCCTISELLDMPCHPLPNYLSVTLTPSNPILHTTRLYSMFRDYHNGNTYPRQILFYEEWTDHSSRVMLKCDEELQALCNAIPMDLYAVRSLREHYESDTPEKMTQKISGIAAFKGITAPMKENAEGWAPDFTSRYFEADFAYGLKVILDLCKAFGISAPTIEQVWKWYTHLVPLAEKDCFQLDMDKEKLLKFYE